MKFWINVEDQLGNKLGDGPIMSATRWEQVKKVNRAGSFSFDMPGTDPRALLIQPKRVVRCFAIINETIKEVGAGIIEKIELQPSSVNKADGAGAIELKVSGDDLLRELTHRSVHFLEIVDGDESFTALADIMAFAPDEWALDTTNGFSSTGTGVYARFAGELVLNALVKLAEKKGELFRLGEGRKLVWLRDTKPASGLRAIQSGEPIALESNEDVCIISTLQETEDSYELMTRIYPYGAGNGQARLDLSKATETLPVGFTVDKANNFIRNDLAESTYGRIDRYMSWKEVAPISNSEQDITNASNVLLMAAYEHLKRFSEPQKAYTISVQKLARVLEPGETLRVIYKRIIDEFVMVDIDETLQILETRIDYDQYGAGVVGLTASTIDRFPSSDAEMLAGQLEQAKLMDAHPQMSMTYAPVGPYTSRIGVGHPANFTVRIVKEVVGLSYAIIRFRTAPLRSSTRSLGAAGSVYTSSGPSSTSTTQSGGGTQTSSGPSSITTTEAGGGINTTGQPSNLTTTAAGGGTSTSSGASSTNTTEGGGGFYGLTKAGSMNRTHTSTSSDFSADDHRPHTHDMLHDHQLELHPHTHSMQHTHFLSIPAHTHSMQHTHDLNLPAHTHSMEHTHTLTLGDHSHSMEHTHTLTLGDHSHSMEHTHTLTLGDHSHSMEHTHTLSFGDHSHSMEHTHTLTLGDHSHNMEHTHDLVLPAHTHDMDHNHTVTIPAHAHNMDHNHTISIGAHSHAIQYGIYQDGQYPGGLRVLINGTDYTSVLGGPWGGGGEYEGEITITNQLLSSSNLRQNHRIEFQATSGQGELELEVDMLVTVQAITFV